MGQRVGGTKSAAMARLKPHSPKEELRAVGVGREAGLAQGGVDAPELLGANQGECGIGPPARCQAERCRAISR